MDLLLGLILLAVVVLIAVIAVVAVRRSRAVPARAPEAPQDPLAQHDGVTDVRTLRAGDMVDYRGILYFVRGSLRITEGGFTWSEHFLDDSRGSRCWISVEEDPDLEVVLWEPADAVPDPGAKTVTVGDTEYQRDERGRATYVSEGTTTVAERGSVEYIDYSGPGDRALGFERFDDGPWEAALGEAVVLSALRVYPAGSTRS